MKFRFAGFILDAAARQLSRGEKSLELSPKALILLDTLVRAHPAAVSNEALYEQLWPNVFVEPANLYNLIAEIRSVLSDEKRQIIRTVQRFGYALAAPVTSGQAHSSYRLIMDGLVVTLKQGRNRIGRDKNVEVFIDSANVSRLHAVITVHDEYAEIEDLGSKNGTLIGKRRLDTVTRLNDGDEIVLGLMKATFRALPVGASTESLRSIFR